MPWFQRADGSVPVDNLPTLRRFMPHVMPRRSDAVLYYSVTVPVEETLVLLEALNKDRSEPLTFFHVVLATMVRTLAERPRLNRFVKGRRIYQRDTIQFSFSVKKGMNEDARLTTVKVPFEADDDLEAVARRVNELISVGRGSARTRAERRMGISRRLPGWMVRALLGLTTWLDDHNLLPASMLAADPLNTSANVANLGSIGVDGTFHHLFNHGTSSIMVTIGRVAQRPVVDSHGQVVARWTVDLKFALDDRICDGYYYARSLERIEHLLSHPEELLGDSARLRFAS